jgi:hypothetical protein
MTRIVTTTYRYKRPPRKKRKAAALEVPAVVITKRSRRPTWKSGGSVFSSIAPPDQDGAAQPSTLGDAECDRAVTSPPPANDDRISAIVFTTSRKRVKLLRPVEREMIRRRRRRCACGWSARNGGTVRRDDRAPGPEAALAVLRRTPRCRPARRALDEPFSAFPSWFMRITCDRCGKDRMLNEAHTARATCQFVPSSIGCAMTAVTGGQGGWNCSPASRAPAAARYARSR